MPDFDMPGYCVKCHKQIADFDGSLPNGNPRITKLSGDFNEATFLLDDGSSMKVAICTDCKNALKPEDAGTIMESVIKGWDHEIKNSLKWEKKDRDSYMKKYGGREIVSRHDVPWETKDMVRLTKPKVKELSK